MNDDFDKVFDVSKPSRVSPDNTSRPIIVGHRPTMPDPMMRRESEVPEPTTKEEPVGSSTPVSMPIAVVSHGAPIASPPSQPASPAGSTIPQHHQAKVVSVSDEVRSEIAASEPKLPEMPVPQPMQPSSMIPAPTPIQSPPGTSSGSSPEQPAASTPSLAAMDVSTATPTSSPGDNVATPPIVVSAPAGITQPVVEPHHQSLPIDSHAPPTSSSRLKHLVLWLFVGLFLLAFAGYLAIDSGFVNSSIKLPFHIFNRQSQS